MINRVLNAVSEGDYIALESAGIGLLRQLPRRW